jgi:hypothetical protein
MADVLNRTTKEYLRNVNSNDYNAIDWLINPDLSGVKNIRKKYWKVIGNTVTEMDAAEKEAVDLQERDILFNSLNTKIGDTLSYSFTDNTLNIQNRWLMFMGNDRSNKSPAIVTYKSRLHSIYFSNSVNNILSQIQIHGMTTGNSISKYNLYATSRSFNKILTDNVYFEQGEKLAVFIKKPDGENLINPSNITLRLDFQIIDVNRTDITYNSIGVFNYV